ncbi:BTE binding protein-like protein 4 [Massarina eburnea CBS 473.64]|uniref:BTE binding protein-like protein 4 n=1 Tax=Massarina eburnea CBS 473.64 TaxID=1395130 RepID=A0A6A6RY75_9PLEO|nr:BTE binding protein-like protein 4 [Massarina eburnea CBS 473.64]
MLSTNSPTGIQRRRTQHRRQHSTPATFETPKVRQSPANIQQRRQQRSGMSLDMRGLDLGSITMSGPVPMQEQSYSGPIHTAPFQQQGSTVSNTNNLGQPSQHIMQVAQPHSQPQPGPQDAFLRSPVQFSPQSPRTPHRTLRHSQRPSLSPAKTPSDRQLKELREHIQSVYGSCGQVFINILPTPTTTPQKPAQLPSHEPLDTAPMPQNLTDMANINLQPTSSAMTFDFENPDTDLGYESSSYYTSDALSPTALSPSPASSPRQRSVQTFLQNINEDATQEMTFSPVSLFPASNSPMSFNGLPQGPLLPELEVDASLEYTGISPEEVQRYISEQDPTSNKWTCLYPECGKVFGRRENIRSHVQTHLGDRQFKCNGCGKCFVRQHDLKRHAKIHSGNKPYKCPCGAGFARQDALTRHRQRGMCVGGFADAVRRQAKRGRPKKTRPDMDDRAEKANRTRRALASAPSSISADSPESEMCSSPFEGFLQAQPLSRTHSETTSFNDPTNASTNPFSFASASSPFSEDTKPSNSSFGSSSSYASEVASMRLIQQLSQNSRTPPMSPAHRRDSVGSMKEHIQPSPLKDSSTPSRSSVQSNPFTTPPTSPTEPRSELDDLFNGLPDNTCSQFELEMKAMDDYSALDDFLDFTA